MTLNDGEETTDGWMTFEFDQLGMALEYSKRLLHWNYFMGFDIAMLSGGHISGRWEDKVLFRAEFFQHPGKEMSVN